MSLYHNNISSSNKKSFFHNIFPNFSDGYKIIDSTHVKIFFIVLLIVFIIFLLSYLFTVIAFEEDNVCLLNYFMITNTNNRILQGLKTFE